MAATPAIVPPAMAPVLDDLDGELMVDGVEDETLEDAVGFEVAAGEPPDGLNAAASCGFEERNPAVRSPTGQPFWLQGLDLQQPKNGGSVALQVYHLLPVGHC